MRALFCLLLACWPGSDAPSDAERYLTATELAETDPVAAATLCAQMSGDREAGDCVLFAARSAALAGGDGLALCELARASEWHDACVFELVDISGLVGEAGRRACSGAGGYASNCLAHLVQREVDALVSSSALGDEAELEAALRALIAQDLPGHDAATEARLLTAAVIAARTQGPFTRAQCGAASPKVCALAYSVLAVWTAGRAPVTTLCPDDLPAHEVPELALADLCAVGARQVSDLLGRWRMRGRRPGEPHGPASPFYRATPAPTPPPR